MSEDTGFMKRGEEDGSRKISLLVRQEEESIRLDAFIASKVPDLSRNQASKLIESGLVSRNQDTCLKGKIRLSAGDLISVEIPEEKPDLIEPEEIPLDILYEDEDLLVVNKPRGMVVHPAVGNTSGTLVNALLWHTGGMLSDVNGPGRPGIVHRIDKDTSGILVCAKTNEAHLNLAEQFRVHSVLRVYTALVRDNMQESEGTVDVPIGRDPKNRLRRAVNGSNPKRAVTHYRVIRRFGKATLVECRLETGRTHQIRVHMAYIKHPLLGDPLYGVRKDRAHGSGQYLHAGVLGFTHPGTGEFLRFEVSLPDWFQEELVKMEKN
ncbi:MAG: RluA family pseudouridine synthase [Eubacteriales bacterium]|nr:RluA family pseudouridine synthase [Eubacteriales bacterium]